ncbi:MAG: OmpP1/FadL family transporter [Bradymonadia bacterium]
MNVLHKRSLSKGLLTWAVAAACLPQVASAGLFDVYGFGARATAMGNAHCAASEDYTAVFYNPGALTVHGKPHVGTGLNVVVPSLYVDRQQSGADAPLTELPESNVGVNLGLLFPLGGLIENRLALGVGLYVPTIQVTRVDAVDVQTPHFHRYDALTDKLVMAAGLAYRVHDRVSIGVGGQLLGTLTGKATATLDPLGRRFLRRDLAVDLETASAPIAGVLVQPADDWRLGFSYRGALSLDYSLSTDLTIQGAGRMVAVVEGQALWTPPTYTWGASWKHQSLSATADLVWSRWSLSPDPSASFNLLLDGEPIDKGSVDVGATPVDLGAKDTLDVRLGMEWRPNDFWALRGGYGFHPTPLPQQTQAPNYIDSAAHQIGLGFGYTFPDPLAMHRSPITLDLSIQGTFLTDREMRKAEGVASSVGSYTAGGQIWHMALQFRHDFD